MLSPSAVQRYRNFNRVLSCTILKKTDIIALDIISHASGKFLDVILVII